MELLQTGPDKPANEFTQMLEGMTKQELVKYARMTYGLSVTARLNKHDLVFSIQEASRKFALNDQLQVGDSLEKGLLPGNAEIQLHRTDLNKKMKSVIVGLNGHMASLPIGTTFGCPLDLVEILEHAVRFEYEQDTTVHPPELVMKEVHSYPFTIHKINPHTPESRKLANKKKGLKGREPKAVRDKQAADLARKLMNLQ